ncbi:MAG: c-type cytochrome [Gemmatimonadetes bacterium]|nr:c-type cytochrome [Gemmatimonadota bacterium]
MRRSLRAVAVLGLVVLASGCSPLDDLMVALAGRSMRDQRSFDPYENPLPAPENSVPFAAGNFTTTPGRINTGQPEMGDMPAPFTMIDVLTSAPSVRNLENPVPADAASLARGQEMYLRMCAVCHGDRGVGTEGYIADKYPGALGIDLSNARTAGFPDGVIYGKIRVGGPIMPAYAHQITHIDRWHIVNYVRELQRRAGNGPTGAGGGR